MSHRSTFVDWGHMAMLSLLAVFAPIRPVLLAVGALILLDTVTGICAARKRGNPITSAALSRTVTKMLVYQSAVVTGFIAERYLIGDAVAVSKIVAGFIGLVETKSVFENLNTVSGDNLLKTIIEKLSSPNQTGKQ